MGMYQSGALWSSMTLAEVVALAEARLVAPNIEKFKLY
jgi:ABC-type transporter Mla maintaining outer membrane lipid asymmetry ATPase subunit MlaF